MKTYYFKSPGSTGKSLHSNKIAKLVVKIAPEQQRFYNEAFEEYQQMSGRKLSLRHNKPTRFWYNLTLLTPRNVGEFLLIATLLGALILTIMSL